MPFGPFYTELPSNGSGGRYIDATSWNRVINEMGQWAGNVDAQQYNLTNLAQLSTTNCTISGTLTSPFLSGVSEVATTHVVETGLTAWYAALNKYDTSGAINVVCLGDSITQGSNASDANHQWVNKVATSLKNSYGDRGAGFYPNWKATLTGSWTPSGNDGPFSSVQYASGNTNTAAVTGVVCDSIDVLFLQTTDSGAFTVQVDSNAAVTMGASSGSPTWTKVRISLTAGTHNVTLSAPNSAAKVYFLGFVFNSGTAGVQVHNVGYSGKQLADTASYTSQLSWLTLLSPDLTVCALGTNETGVNVTNFSANLTRLVTSASAYGSVLLSVPPPSTTSGRDANTTTLRKTMQNVAAAQGCALVDIFARWGGSGSTANSLGLIDTDGINPTNAGHADYARIIKKRIMDEKTEFFRTYGTGGAKLSGDLVVTGRSVSPLPTATALVAATAIPSTSRNVNVTTASNTTLTSAPSITAGTDGQELTVINTGTFNLTLSDNGTLAGSTLRLTATTLTLAPRQNITFVYVTAYGWVQKSTLVAVI